MSHRAGSRSSGPSTRGLQRSRRIAKVLKCPWWDSSRKSLVCLILPTESNIQLRTVVLVSIAWQRELAKSVRLSALSLSSFCYPIQKAGEKWPLCLIPFQPFITGVLIVLQLVYFSSPRVSLVRPNWSVIDPPPRLTIQLTKCGEEKGRDNIFPSRLLPCRLQEWAHANTYGWVWLETKNVMQIGNLSLWLVGECFGSAGKNEANLPPIRPPLVPFGFEGWSRQNARHLKPSLIQGAKHRSSESITELWSLKTLRYLLLILRMPTQLEQSKCQRNLQYESHVQILARYGYYFNARWLLIRVIWAFVFTSGKQITYQLGALPNCEAKM